MVHEHAIRLGVELDGRGDPAAAVEQAVAAERLGYDLVVVADGGAGFADAWTMATWIAARTERIALVPVTDDATRPATVLARATAGLDLLSGGRVTLGLSGDDPEAVADAVAVARRMWDPSAPAVHREGRHRVAEAEPGPAPAHEVPVWVSGDDAGLLDVAGRVADGWIGHLGMEVDPLLARLDALHRHATDAGRDLRELRRVVTAFDRETLTAEQWVERLRPLAEHGVTTFVLRVGEWAPVERLEWFADEVVPALEESARRAVAAGLVAARPLRRATVRAHRRPGIDYDGLPESLAAGAVEPGDLRYSGVRSTYLRGGRPGLVLRPRSVAEVVDAVAFARRHRDVPLGVRSGGHGISGRSTNDGGLVIDVGALNQIEVLDASRRLVRIGPGARWKQVARALQPHGWALSSGDYGGVGVGGLATAGGIGFLGRKHGLTIDHLRAVEMVLADGSVVRATEQENAELFWAARGAGANFGIATAFEFVVDEVPAVGWAQLGFEVADPAAFLADFGRVTKAAPRETTPFVVFGRSGIAHVMAMVDSGDPDVIVSQLQPFAQIAPMVQQQVVIAPYADVMDMYPDTPHQAAGEPIARSGLVDDLTPEVAAASARLMNSGAVYFFQIRSMGAAVSDVAPDATAFAHRGARFQITAMGADDASLDRAWEQLAPYLNGTYLSFDTRVGPDRVADAFPPATLARLRSLKRELDPSNLFRDNFNVATPLTAGSAS
ncbi:LLM class flavin-dependent oxidoreductase [Aeromicrobium senzhongii]|uniref:LLM class flavin-dependent oxidoreductase n=1 Tax=Aeromicrobium senzhongii TaxID=2663859 RepID=A0ABX6SYI1_9ACTN|nr:LLM class flavin-dependent oxidoreductase [Aeromicrobium senzhongii]MTB87650.1 LLM class flavin-dependent oxidoreductase [Aeromicrobium senzhongii]QNL95315.1 LLM class flavin-dependent oxidoreductase [Aeromicrobium senzhongii]